MSKSNPTNSSCLQALICLKESGFMEVGPLIKELQRSCYDQGKQAEEMRMGLKRADDMLQGKLYSDKSLKWGKLYDDVDYSNLSPITSKFILAYLYPVTHQCNLIELKQSDIQELMDVSKPTAAKIIRELQDNDLIRLFKHKSHERGALYRVNPKAYCVGRVKAKEYESLEKNTTLPKSTIKAVHHIDKLNGLNYVSIAKKEGPEGMDAPSDPNLDDLPFITL